MSKIDKLLLLLTRVSLYLDAGCGQLLKLPSLAVDRLQSKKFIMNVIFHLVISIRRPDVLNTNIFKFFYYFLDKWTIKDYSCKKSQLALRIHLNGNDLIFSDVLCIKFFIILLDFRCYLCVYCNRNIS